MWRKSIILIPLLLFGFLSIFSTFASADSWQPTCGATYCLDTSHGFTLAHANTLSWINTLSISGYTQFDSHVNFTGAGLGTNGGNANFGLGANGANLQITSITSNSLQAVESFTGGNATAFVFYYYGTGGVVPTQANAILGGFSSTVLSQSYYTNFTSWSAASAPAVFQNTTGNYLEFKQQTNGATINFQLGGTPVVQCTSYKTSTNTASSSLGLAIILPVLVIAGAIIFILFMIATRKFNIALGDSATNGIILMGIVFMVVILITIITYVVINGGQTGIGC